jgi:small nuclear ribonucleoprotein (snRNP)-like protein
VTAFEARRRSGAHLRRKEVTVLLVGGRTLQGELHVSEGQSLIGSLSEKQHFLNLTNVVWDDAAPQSQPLTHLSIRISNIVWIVPEDGSLYLTSAEDPTDTGRNVELHLVGSLTLHVTLHIAEELRMSDYFDSGTRFVPLRHAHILSTARTIDRLAVNHRSIQAIRDL